MALDYTYLHLIHFLFVLIMTLSNYEPKTKEGKQALKRLHGY